MQIGCACAVYIFATRACKTNIQIIAFAAPSFLIMPITILGLFGICDVKNQDPCLFKPDLLSQLKFQCPVDSKNGYMVWFEDFGNWVGIIWFLSSIWIIRHIWIPKSQRMASIDQIFGRPLYSGIT